MNYKHNPKNEYVILDSDGKIVEKFRTKATALNLLSYYQKVLKCKCTIISKTKLEKKEDELHTKL